MSSFDGWETRLCGDAMALPARQLSGNELMHFRTKGSKNGVRRYQNADGSWTPLGLRERKEREGWGETRKERKAAKAVAKAEKKAARVEKRAAKLNAKSEAKAALKTKLKKKDLSGLSDEELKKKIERVKMEQEYKELTRSPILKAGEKIINTYLEMQANKANREEAKAKRELESNRIKADVIKAKEATKKAEAEAMNAKMELKKMKQDRKAGLATDRQAKLIQAKIGYKATTIRGGIAKRINQKLTAGVSDKVKARRTAEGKVEADKILRIGQEQEAKRQANLLAAEQKRQEREAKKARKKYNRFNRKIDSQYGLSGQLNY